MFIKTSISEILYLGPEGSYTQIATEKFIECFNLKNLKQTPINSIKKIIESVDKNPNLIAVLPIENSIEGVVRETIDNLILRLDKSLCLQAETIVDINHCLLSKGLNLKHITNIISHPQALAQCRNYICNNFTNFPNLITTGSTAEAAKQLDTLGKSFAAIANKKTAHLYNLNILKENINDEKDNKTRFVLLSRIKTTPTQADKTSIVFSTKNESGALVNVLEIFKKYNINLLYIDSRPSKKNLKEYNFYLEFDGHINDENVEDALNETKKYINFFCYNGSFAKTC